MDRRAARRQVARGGEPESAAVGEPHELLRRRASDGVLADDVGTLVTGERGRENTSAACAMSRWSRAASPGSVIAPSPLAAVTSTWSAAAFAADDDAVADEQARRRDAQLGAAVARVAEVDHQVRSAILLQRGNGLLASSVGRAIGETRPIRSRPTPGFTILPVTSGRRVGLAHQFHRARLGGVAANHR